MYQKDTKGRPEVGRDWEDEGNGSSKKLENRNKEHIEKGKKCRMQIS